MPLAGRRSILEQQRCSLSDLRTNCAQHVSSSCIDSPSDTHLVLNKLKWLRGAYMSEQGPKLDYRDPEWVAEKLCIDKNTVYKYLQEGSLPGLQLGRKWLVSERRLAEFLERVEREQTERRRAMGGQPRPFALPPKLRMIEDDETDDPT